MVWERISIHGTGRFYIVEKTMKQEQYKNVLKKYLLPRIKKWFGRKKCIFIQDRAPI
jgi:hypothetical protein